MLGRPSNYNHAGRRTGQDRVVGPVGGREGVRGCGVRSELPAPRGEHVPGRRGARTRLRIGGQGAPWAFPTCFCCCVAVCLSLPRQGSSLRSLLPCPRQCGCPGWPACHLYAEAPHPHWPLPRVPPIPLPVPTLPHRRSPRGRRRKPLAGVRRCQQQLQEDPGEARRPPKCVSPPDTGPRGSPG